MKNFLKNMFQKKKKPKQQDISIHENISGNYFYHIAIDDVPLCGAKNTMRRGLPLSSWGMKSSHIGERYCEKCTELWTEGFE